MSAYRYPYNDPDGYEGDAAPYYSFGIRSLGGLERALLGAVIITGEFPRTLPRPDEFTLEATRVTWQTLLEMKERGDAVDLVLLTLALERTGRLERAGGWTYVCGLVDDTSCDLIDTYARKVQECAASRRISRLGKR